MINLGSTVIQTYLEVNSIKHIKKKRILKKRTIELIKKKNAKILPTSGTILRPGQRKRTKAGPKAIREIDPSGKTTAPQSLFQPQTHASENHRRHVLRSFAGSRSMPPWRVSGQYRYIITTIKEAMRKLYNRTRNRCFLVDCVGEVRGVCCGVGWVRGWGVGGVYLWVSVMLYTVDDSSVDSIVKS